ncbi:MAG: GNAT family N-acetyltransferase [Lachnospiraceae bacterium]|nr:GNAT family N-acetyltransferase [Lachnospiraceae bacterium]
MKRAERHTERLVLRPLGREDMEAFYEYASDAEYTKYMVYYPHRSKERTKTFLEQVEAEWRKEVPQFYEFAVLLSGEHIGTATLYLEGEGVGELAWMLHPKYLHRGFATEAAKAVKEFAESVLHLKLLTACCDSRNKASAAVMERLGMNFVCERERVYPDERGNAREYYYELTLHSEPEEVRHPEEIPGAEMGPRGMVDAMDGRYALFGLLFAFQNRLQAVGDAFYEEITCKQFFLLACMNLFPGEAPTVQDLAQIMGSSHQNVKQIINKLEQKGFLSVTPDEADRRKLRIRLTEYAGELAEKYQRKEEEFMTGLFAGVPAEEAKQAFVTLSKMEANLMKLRAQEETE